MQDEASQGVYPGRAPFGYGNNEGTRSIEIHREKSAIAQRVFELYVSGRYSFLTHWKLIRGRRGIHF